MKQAKTTFLVALICTLASLVFAGDMTVMKADDFVKQLKATEFIYKIDESLAIKKVYVDPYMWAVRNVDDKKNFTYVAVIHISRSMNSENFKPIEILDKNSGKKLAKWNKLGYKLYN